MILDPCYWFREDDDEPFVLDRETICTPWQRLWSAFGFNEHQWISRAAKVEEYTQVRLRSN